MKNERMFPIAMKVLFGAATIVVAVRSWKWLAHPATNEIDSGARWFAFVLVSFLAAMTLAPRK